MSVSYTHLDVYKRQLIRFTEERAVPYHYETWARDLAAHYPHIRVEVEEA